MKERNHTKANDKAASVRREIKQSDQQSSDSVGFQIFPHVQNKDTFDPPKFSHINAHEQSVIRRLSPPASLGALI